MLDHHFLVCFICILHSKEYIQLCNDILHISKPSEVDECTYDIFLLFTLPSKYIAVPQYHILAYIYIFHSPILNLVYLHNGYKKHNHKQHLNKIFLQGINNLHLLTNTFQPNKEYISYHSIQYYLDTDTKISRDSIFSHQYKGYKVDRKILINMFLGDSYFFLVYRSFFKEPKLL